MKPLFVLTLLASCLMSGCASYSGRGLVIGQSTASDAETLMGKPAERIEKPGGGSVLYYPRGPSGRETYAVVVGADGKVQAVEQRLTDANIAKVVPGTTAEREVRELFGPPAATVQFWRLERNVWEYRMDLPSAPYILLVQFSYDGLVREVYKMRDHDAEAASGPGGMP